MRLSPDVDSLNIIEIEVATLRWSLTNGLSLESGWLRFCLRLGLSWSCFLRVHRNGLLLILWKSFIHLDHLVIETVSGRVKLGTTIARVVVIQLFLSLLSAFLEEGLALCLKTSLTTL